MDLVLVTAPAADVVSLAEAKAQLGVQDSDTDAYISGLIAAATAWLDGHAGILGRGLVSQKWRLRFDDAFPAWEIPIPLAPLIAVTSFTYVASDGTTATLVENTDFTVLDGPRAAVVPAYGKAWPAPRCQPRAVTIEFTAGYGTTGASVPAALRTALLMQVAHLFENRESVVGVDQRGTPMPTPLGALDLIRPYIARSAA
jgi:uncharacterized phiE125 gp8 family phage protein